MTEISYSIDAEIVDPHPNLSERSIVLSANDPFIEDTCEGEGLRIELVFDRHAARRMRDLCNDFLEAGDGAR